MFGRKNYGNLPSLERAMKRRQRRYRIEVPDLESVLDPAALAEYRHLMRRHRKAKFLLVLVAIGLACGTVASSLCGSVYVSKLCDLLIGAQILAIAVILHMEWGLMVSYGLAGVPLLVCSVTVMYIINPTRWHPVMFLWMLVILVIQGGVIYAACREYYGGRRLNS